MNDYAVIDDLRSIADARMAVREFTSKTRASDGLFDVILKSGDEFLDESWIPPAGGDRNPFLALHFDYGHPLFPHAATEIYLLVALYAPQSTVTTGAATRILRVKDCSPQLQWGSPGDIEGRLRSYASSHGSSWDWETDSGNRTSCFARILDALSATHQLTNFRKTPRERWYEVSKAGHEFETVAEESAFYAGHGVALESVERRIVLRPGQLLLLNNVTTVHGRLGPRRPQELFQFVLGARRVPAENATVIRKWLTGALAVRFAAG
jgi:hypothetical protein